MDTDDFSMSLLCCCVPRAQQKPPRLKIKTPQSEVELQEFRVVRELPREIWAKILKLLPLHVLWRSARPTCHIWNAITLEIVWNTVVQPTVVDVLWYTNEKRVRQRLYPVLSKSHELVDFTPFSTIARWNLPTFEKALYSSDRQRYKCTNVVILLPSGKSWQNTAGFTLVKSTGRRDVWEFEQFTSRDKAAADLTKELFDPSWLARWMVTFKEDSDRSSSSSSTRGSLHLNHVTVPLAQFVKLFALAEEEEWPSMGKIDGFDRKKARSRPNSGILTPIRRRSEPNS